MRGMRSWLGASLLWLCTALVVTGAVAGAAAVALGSTALTQAGQEDPQESPPSADQMAGAMIMVGFRDSELPPDAPILADVAAGRVGGVVLFDRDVLTGGTRNIITPDQVQRLTATLQAAAPRPLLIAVDQEGGKVQRLKAAQGFTELPSAAAMGRGHPDSTGVLALRLGMDLARLGINVNLAPVVDVNINPQSPAIGLLERSFSHDMGLVSLHGQAFGRGMADSGVIPALKHFPGHGSAKSDSHLGVADISTSYDSLQELKPYVELFDRGWPGMVLVGHLFHSNLDETYPTSLSAKTINGLLRGSLGWQGVVISDDMQMKAITEHYTLEQSILLAVQAGTDILLFGNNMEWEPDMGAKVHKALMHLVDTGRISSQRLITSWERIQKMKKILTHTAQLPKRTLNNRPVHP